MFGFPEAQHSVYKTNFLRNVIYKFRFQEIQNFSNKESEFREILDSHFPQFELKNADSVSFSFNNKNIGDIEAVKGEQKQYIFKSKNEKIILDFQNTSISVNILGNEYISFENLQPSIEILKNLLSNNDIKILTNISVRKLNVIGIKNSNSPDYNIGQISFQAFNEFINDSNDIPDKQSILNNFRVITMRNENDFLNLKFGLNSPSNIPGNLTDIFIDNEINSNNIIVDSLLDKLLLINKELFNIFEWVTTENFKNILK